MSYQFIILHNLSKWLTNSFLIEELKFGAKNYFYRLFGFLQSDILKAVLAGDAIIGSMVRPPYLLMVANMS